MKISTKDLSITTPSVTINAIKINNKQMTLAVFRQLDIKELSEYILNPINTFIIWGRVNYKTNHIKDYININWIIFEKDGFLYRDSLERIYSVNIRGTYHTTIDYMINSTAYQIRNCEEYLKENKKFLNIILEGDQLAKNELMYRNMYRGKNIEEVKEDFIDTISKCEFELEIFGKVEKFIKNYQDLKQLFIAV